MITAVLTAAFNKSASRNTDQNKYGISTQPDDSKHRQLMKDVQELNLFSRRTNGKGRIRVQAV